MPKGHAMVGRQGQANFRNAVTFDIWKKGCGPTSILLLPPRLSASSADEEGLQLWVGYVV